MSGSRTSNSGLTGCGVLGMIVASIISWSLYHSVGWLIVHGLFGWLYVIYWYFTGPSL